MSTSVLEVIPVTPMPSVPTQPGASRVLALQASAVMDSPVQVTKPPLCFISVSSKFKQEQRIIK